MFEQIEAIAIGRDQRWYNGGSGDDWRAPNSILPAFSGRQTLGQFDFIDSSLGGRKVLVAGMFDFLNVFSTINFEVIFQLTMLAMIVIAGPAVVILLAFRGGNL
jgi:Photosystem II complex subunit Ycf12